MTDDMYLRKDIYNPTNRDINFWGRNLSGIEKDIIRLMRTSVKDELIKYQIYIPTVIQPIEYIDSTAWGDYGWEEVADDENIPEGAYFVIFELLLIVQNNTIKPFINHGLYMQHNLPTIKSKIIVDEIFKKYFGEYYHWDMSEKASIRLQ